MTAAEKIILHHASRGAFLSKVIDKVEENGLTILDMIEAMRNLTEQSKIIGINFRTPENEDTLLLSTNVRLTWKLRYEMHVMALLRTHFVLKLNDLINYLGVRDDEELHALRNLLNDMVSKKLLVSWLVERQNAAVTMYGLPETKIQEAVCLL